MTLRSIQSWSVHYGNPPFHFSWMCLLLHCLCQFDPPFTMLTSDSWTPFHLSQRSIFPEGERFPFACLIEPQWSSSGSYKSKRRSKLINRSFYSFPKEANPVHFPSWDFHSFFWSKEMNKPKQRNRSSIILDLLFLISLNSDKSVY